MRSPPSARYSLPLSRAEQAYPCIEVLSKVGAPIEVCAEQHKLPRASLESPDLLVSTRALWAFVETLARREGVDDVGWRAPRLDQLDVGLMRMLHRSTTLMVALEATCLNSYRESSRARFWVQEQEDAILWCARGSLEPGAVGRDQASLMRVKMMLAIVRTFTGPSWRPPEVAFAAEHTIPASVYEDLGATRVLRSPIIDWVRLPRSVLGLPPVTLVKHSGSHGNFAPDVESDLIASLRRLVRPYLRERLPNVQDVADLTGRRTRSLQRDLARAGSTYREALQGLKFDVARELLLTTEAKLVDVANEVGFEDPSHFARFFRRRAGLSPSAFRATHRKGQPTESISARLAP